MPFHKTCEKYLDKRSHKVDRLLGKVIGGYQKEDYHELRVEIKKIKALVKMASHTLKINERQLLAPYLKVFKRAGLVRDAQMAGELLKKEKPSKWLQQYRADLQTQTQLNEKDFYLSVDKKLRNDLSKAHKKARSFAKEMRKRDAERYIRKEEQKIDGIIDASRTSIKDAHRLRKKLKRIGYIMPLVKQKLTKDIRNVETIQEELGTWHDHCQLAARLRRDAAKQPAKQKKVHMHKLEKSLNTRAKKMFAKIRESLRIMHDAKLKSPTRK